MDEAIRIAEVTQEDNREEDAVVIAEDAVDPLRVVLTLLLLMLLIAEAVEDGKDIKDEEIVMVVVVAANADVAVMVVVVHPMVVVLVDIIKIRFTPTIKGTSINATSNIIKRNHNNGLVLWNRMCLRHMPQRENKNKNIMKINIGWITFITDQETRNYARPMIL